MKTIILEEIIKITWKQVQIEKSSDNNTEVGKIGI